MVRDQECQWALTQKRTLRGVAAHLRLVIFVSLRMAASAVTPLSPMWLTLRLRARGRMGWGVSMGTDMKANTLELV